MSVHSFIFIFFITALKRNELLCEKNKVTPVISWTTVYVSRSIFGSWGRKHCWSKTLQLFLNQQDSLVEALFPQRHGVSLWPQLDCCCYSILITAILAVSPVQTHWQRPLTVFLPINTSGRCTVIKSDQVKVRACKLQPSRQKENVMLELELLPVKINHPLAQRLSLPIFNYTQTFTYLLRGDFPHQYTCSAWNQ